MVIAKGNIRWPRVDHQAAEALACVPFHLLIAVYITLPTDFQSSSREIEMYNTFVSDSRYVLVSPVAYPPTSPRAKAC